MENSLTEDNFKPHPLLWNGHLQTIIPSKLKRPLPGDWDNVREMRFQLFDGSEVSCRYLERNLAAPTLFILHGMGGSNRSRYILGLMERSRPQGWNVFCPSMYDISETKRKPTVFHSGCSRMIDDLLKKAARKLEFGEVLLSGVSMGGNIILKMIGEWGGALPENVKGAAVISPLVDLPGSADKMEQHSTFIYRHSFLKKLRATMVRQAVRYQHYADLERVNRARTLRQFDAAFTAPLSGFASVDEYYSTQGSEAVLEDISIPTCIVHSLDDPVLTSRALHTGGAVNNPEITVCLTRKGGHVGFLSARPEGERGSYWAENRVIDFLDRVSTIPGT